MPTVGDRWRRPLCGCSGRRPPGARTGDGCSPSPRPSRCAPSNALCRRSPTRATIPIGSPRWRASPRTGWPGRCTSGGCSATRSRRELLAALPLEDMELDPSGPDIAALREPAGTDDDRFWRAIAVARLGDLATLDRELDRLDRGQSAPHVFDGSPWTAYEQLAAVRPLPPDVEAHLLARPPGLVVWALTGTADAEGTPLDDSAPRRRGGRSDGAGPVARRGRCGGDAGAPRRRHARRLRRRERGRRVGAVVPRAGAADGRAVQLCGSTAASEAQLAWLAGRGGLRRAAVEMAGDIIANPQRRDEALAFLREIARTYTANPFEGSGSGAPAPPPRFELVEDRAASPAITTAGAGPRHRGRRHLLRRRRRLVAPTAPPVASRSPNGTTPPGSPRRPTRGGRDLHVHAGPPVAGNMLQGVTRIAGNEVPEGGLLTSWLVRAGRRALRTTDPRPCRVGAGGTASRSGSPASSCWSHRRAPARSGRSACWPRPARCASTSP